MSCPAGISDTCPNALTGTSSGLFLTLINTLLTTKCLLDPTSTYPKDYDCSLDTFDFIVVGGGTAGTVIANRLTENPNWKVLLIEAGGLPKSDNEIPALTFYSNTNDWNYNTISPGMCLAFKDKRCIWPRGKVLGGCSSINAMLYTRGRKQDYDNWERDGNVGWNYNSALHYFKKSENLQSDIHDQTLHGFNGPLTTSHYNFPRKIRTGIKEAAEQSGYKVTIEPPNIGYCEVLMTIENGKRCSNAKAFISKIKNRTNLYLSTNTLVEKLLINNSTKTVNGVLISNGKCGTNYKLYATKEVILSAGATGSPEILLKSDIGPGKYIADLPVGENLQDHLINLGVLVKFNDSVADPVSPYDAINMLYEYFLKYEGPLAKMDLINLFGYIDTTNCSDYPNIEMMHDYYPKNDLYNLPVTLSAVGLDNSTLGYLISLNKDYDLMSFAPVLLLPKSKGTIRINEGKVEIYPNYLQDKDDVVVMLAAIDYIKEFLKTPAMRAFGAELVPMPLPDSCGKFDTETYWLCVLKYYCGSVFHPIGTCKMGPENDKTAVVSPCLKVHGVSNLRVIDASIMPRHITAHTNAPTTMIAEMGADIIKKQYGYLNI